MKQNGGGGTSKARTKAVFASTRTPRERTRKNKFTHYFDEGKTESLRRPRRRHISHAKKSGQDRQHATGKNNNNTRTQDGKSMRDHALKRRFVLRWGEGLWDALSSSRRTSLVEHEGGAGERQVPDKMSHAGKGKWNARERNRNDNFVASRTTQCSSFTTRSFSWRRSSAITSRYV